MSLLSTIITYFTKPEPTPVRHEEPRITLEDIINETVEVAAKSYKDVRIVLLDKTTSFIPASHAKIPDGKSIVTLSQSELLDYDPIRLIHTRHFLTLAHNAKITFYKIA